MRRIVKIYFTIKGFIHSLSLQKGEYYVSKHIPDSRLMYQGKKTFYKAWAKMCEQVEVFQQEEKKYKYWEIGVLDFEKD